MPSARTRASAPRVEVTVIREAGTSVSRQVMLDGERFLVGSHPKNDLVLVDPEVSRFHCVIERGENAWQVTDSGSLNGTRLAGISVRNADLPPVAELEVGGSVVQIREIPAATEIELIDQASFGEMFGQSRTMQRLFAVVDKVAASDANVLIEGESGTGKELVASEIVRQGARAKKPLVIFDCSAIAPSLIESELFGHVKGAFTGADRDRAGAFEAAHGGTVFLDEVGELPLEMQPKLLRLLETREVRRIGENTPRRVDVRVVAATNRQLQREVNQGRFREDLYYRLSVVTVHVPALRDRREDIPLLVRAFLRSLGATRDTALFDDAVMARLQRYDWPGNVRELRNYVERCVVLRSATPTEERGSVPPEEEAAPSIDLDVPFREAKERAINAFERRYVEALMEWSGGNVSRAARRANMDRMNLYRILQRSGLRTLDE